VTTCKTALITAAAALALAGAVHNASARDCTNPRDPVCAAPAPAPQPGAAERLNQTVEERLQAEERLLALRQQQEAELLEARRQEQQREDWRWRRGVASGFASDVAARRGSSKSESELGYNRSGSELSLDRSAAELGR
jgi:hypothetical protein